ncbi:MAG: hypothetical protein ACK4WM_04950 [Thermoflexales bacterium]
MISAQVFFVFYIVLFGMIGTLRGWVREVIVLFAMLFAIFMYNLPQFGQFWQTIVTSQSDSNLAFAIKSLPFVLITFFGYLSPLVAKERFQPSSTSTRFEYGLLSFLVGAFNGYVFLSSLARWALEIGVLAKNPELFVQPPSGWEQFFFIESAAPVVFSGTLLVFVVFAIFVFMIIVLV